MRCLAAIMVLALAPAACIPMPERNAHLGTTREQAMADLNQMRREPKVLDRPVVVLNGYHGLPTLANRITRKLRAATSRDTDDFLSISYMLGGSIDTMTERVVREVEERWPCADPEFTTEVDVVAISMGGIIARWGELPPSDRIRAGTPPSLVTGKRLRIRRLFTLGTPHRGATLAEWIRIDSAAVDLRAGSPLLATLDAHAADRAYELFCYGQMRDLIVGATRTAPPGAVPIWTSGTFFFSHLDLADNPVFLADIARHLRDESPRLVPVDPPPRD